MLRSDLFVKFFVLLLFICGQLKASAQISWFQQNDTWFIGHCVVQPDVFFNFVKHDSFSIISCVEDTVINETPCKKFVEESYQGLQSPDSPFFMYEDSGKVFWYNPEVLEFEMLYDMDWEVGTEIELTSLLPFDESCGSTLMRVDSIDQQVIGGIERKVLHCSIEMNDIGPLYYVGIVEGIGKLDHPLTYYHCLMDAPGPGYLRCFSRQTEEAISFSELECDYVTSVEEENVSTQLLQVRPIPTTNSLVIDLPSGLSYSECEIFDTNGKRFSAHSYSNSIGSSILILPRLNNGLYLIYIQTHQGIELRSKFVVQN
jgi:hypothetical protein